MKEDIGDLEELAKRISKQMREIERELQNENLSQKEKISLRGVYAVLAGTLQRVFQALGPLNNEQFEKNWEEMTTLKGLTALKKTLREVLVTCREIGWSLHLSHNIRRYRNLPESYKNIRTYLNTGY